jgi:predicted transposase/invertase (TIGR01784 family)
LLETNRERWCYLFKNLNKFAEVPANQAGFEDLFSIAQTGELTEKELRKYVTSMVTEYDRKVIGEYFHKEGYAAGMVEGMAKGRKDGREEGLAEGRAEGLAEGKQEAATKIKKLGVPVEIIADATGLTLEEIDAL